MKTREVKLKEVMILRILVGVNSETDRVKLLFQSEK
jgi:hypothetical protein